MYKYTPDELTNKIHTFLEKKNQQFPDLEAEATKPVRHIQVKHIQRTRIISPVWA